MRLPQKDSAAWRAIITSGEGTIVLMAGLIAIPEVGEYLVTYRPELLPVFPLVLGLANFLRNYKRSDIENY